MHLQDARWIPVISYVGRLRDSRKGFEVFLEALEMLWDDRASQDFKAWVIGGSAEDKQWAEKLALCRPNLRSKTLSGDLYFWGHVENSCLPEFYSRSTALVVPSFREQFCITAVEAMMCGCPVIASRVGGLQDVVVADKTGNLFDRGSASALAAVMASYLGEPSLANWLGANGATWTRARFDETLVCSSLLELFDNPLSFQSRWHEDPDSAFRQLAIEQALPKIQTLLGSRVESFEDITSGPSTSLRVRLEGGDSVFVKIYTDRPTDLSCLDPKHYNSSSHLIPRERISLALHLQHQSFFPEILAHDLASGIIIQRWQESRPPEKTEARRLLRLAVKTIQDSALGTELQKEREAIRHALAVEEEASVALLDQVDLMTAALHAPLIGGSLRVRSLHPQLELHRLERIIARNERWLPSAWIQRAKALLAFLRSDQPLFSSLPTFGHGSLKAEHLLDSLPILCDFDHSGYFCGPADAAHWIWEYCTSHAGGHPGPMFRLLAEETADFQDWFLGVCWITTSRIKRDLVVMTRGSSEPSVRSLLFSQEFSNSFRTAHSLIRNRGPIEN